MTELTAKEHLSSKPELKVYLGFNTSGMIDRPQDLIKLFCDRNWPP